MSVRKGIVPIIAVIICAGVLTLSGGGYIGVRYRKSVVDSETADRLFNDGRYDEALSYYNKSLSRWQRDEIKQKISLTEKERNAFAIFDEARNALYQSNWQTCLDKIKTIDAETRSYSNAQSLSAECQGWIDKEAKRKADEEAASKNVENKPVATSAAPTQASGKTTPSPAPAAAPSSNTESSPQTSPTATTPAESNSDSANTTTATCRSNTNPTFSSHITDTSKIESVAVPPRIVGGHLKTHSYINTNHQRVPVYAPAAMTLYGGVHLSHGNDPDDYGMDFKVSCEVMVRIGHITDPIQSIKDTFPVAQSDSFTNYNITPINFAAGDLLGYTTGTAAAGNWDFGVYNSSTSNRYANDPDWNNSAIYTTAVCPYEYFSSNLKTSYTSKYIQDFGVSILDGEFFCR